MKTTCQSLLSHSGGFQAVPLAVRAQALHSASSDLPTSDGNTDSQQRQGKGAGPVPSPTASERCKEAKSGHGSAASSAPEPQREWRDTGLCAAIKSGQRRSDAPGEVQLTVVSYNVLADSLMQMHRELYTGKYLRLEIKTLHLRQLECRQIGGRPELVQPVSSPSLSDDIFWSGRPVSPGGAGGSLLALFRKRPRGPWLLRGVQAEDRKQD